MESRRRVHVLTLGCPKNEVDTEVMLGVLTRAGHELVLDPDAADVLVVNTCAFIGPAKEESIDAILEAARVKAAREGRRLVVTGCLAQRFADDLVRELPEVDAFVGTGDLTRIAEAVTGPHAEVPVVYRGAQHELPAHGVSPRVRTGAWWTAYLKVSEGCDHRCSFCIIPKIRGRHESRAMADVLAEAESLVADGAVELNLIAQDLTAYGRDRADGATLARLLRALAVRVPGARWLRLLYAYPSSVTDDLLHVIATEPAVCKYLDMPLQHIADDMLRAMRRERSGAAIRRLLRRIRAAVPGIALRSAFIVGFPGETEAHIDELCDFLEEADLDRVGVFRYSPEEGTHAAGLAGQLPERVKRRRWERVMETQARIAARRSRAQVGCEVEALVEGEGREPGWVVGRSRDRAPEIDGMLLMRGEASPGDLVRVLITGADTYDLRGVVEAPCAVDTPAPRL
ncbi:MAG TPA: 30S ribosomal protein S12 methylthiotransferase RimO [Candidatus Binatia bacterium]|nr:30S ribosomal protein S12 methylthiotransferase RimO [Candidatus Binatia bacterium]